MALSEGQLVAMEQSAPLLVEEYRKLFRLALRMKLAYEEVTVDSDRTSREDRARMIGAYLRLDEYL